MREAWVIFVFSSVKRANPPEFQKVGRAMHYYCIFKAQKSINIHFYPSKWGRDAVFSAFFNRQDFIEHFLLCQVGGRAFHCASCYASWGKRSMLFFTKKHPYLTPISVRSTGDSILPSARFAICSFLKKHPYLTPISVRSTGDSILPSARFASAVLAV